MPKILIISDCNVNFADGNGGIHQSSGDMPSVEKKVAGDLVRAGRALYIDKKDDPDRRARDTASAEMVAAAQALQKSRSKNTKPLSAKQLAKFEDDALAAWESNAQLREQHANNFDAYLAAVLEQAA